jgi:hypothetical protein
VPGPQRDMCKESVEPGTRHSTKRVAEDIGNGRGPPGQEDLNNLGRISGLCRVDDANAKATPIEAAITREQSVGLLRRVRPDQKVRHHTVP